jgi:hypothetical protein
MVAAWMRAETGVGPSIASGSQTCSGTWPDLPAAPQKIRIAIAEAAEKPGSAKSQWISGEEIAAPGKPYQTR